jgi:hypothetical protein
MMFRFSYCLALFGLVLFSCGEVNNSKHLPKRRLSLSDLSFPNIDGRSIRDNRIDTVFLLSADRYVKLAFGKQIHFSDTVTILDRKVHRVGYMVYDSLGRPIFNNAERWDAYTYGYDSAGILTDINYQEYDVTYLYTSKYKFDSDSLILHQNWTNIKFAGGLSTSKFEFDSIGRLVQESAIEKYPVSNGVRRILKRFKYRGPNLIEEYEQIYEDEKSMSEKSIKIYYKNDNLVDSTLTTYAGKKNDYGRKIITYYEKGLKAKSIVNDSLLITYGYSKKL